MSFVTKQRVNIILIVIDCLPSVCLFLCVCVCGLHATTGQGQCANWSTACAFVCPPICTFNCSLSLLSFSGFSEFFIVFISIDSNISIRFVSFVNRFCQGAANCSQCPANWVYQQRRLPSLTPDTQSQRRIAQSINNNRLTTNCCCEFTFLLFVFRIHSASS